MKTNSILTMGSESYAKNIALGICLLAIGGCNSEGNDNPPKIDVEPVSSQWQQQEIVDLSSGGGLLSNSVKAVVDKQMPNLVHFFYLLDTPRESDDQPLSYDLHHKVWDLQTASVYSNSVDETIVTLDNTLGLSIAIGQDNSLYTAYRGGDRADCNTKQSDAMFSFKGPSDQNWTEYLAAIGDSSSRNPAYRDGDAGDYTSLAVDSAGNVHMVFQFFWEGCDSNNAAHPDIRYIMKVAGAYDSYQTVDEEAVEGNDYRINYQNSVGFHSSLILDADENPVVFYYAEQTRENFGLRVGRRVNGSWELDWVDPGCQIGAISGGLAPDGKIAVAYYIHECAEHISYTQDDQFALRYAVYDGESWKIEVIDEATKAGDFTSLTFDSSSNPAIAYYEFESFGVGRQSELYNLKLANFDAEKGGWFKQRVAETGDIGRYNNLWYDSEDRVHIATFSKTETRFICLVSKNNESV